MRTTKPPQYSHNPHHQPPLDTFFQDHLILKSRIALLALYKITYPKWFEVSLLLFEYLQLISQIILFLPDLSETSHNRLIFQIIIYICKLVNPSYLLTFQNSDSITQSVLILMLVLTLLKHLIHLYVLATISWNKEGSRTIIVIWRMIFKVQGRMWCFFISSFWVRTILKVRDEGFSLFGVNMTTAIILLSFLWAIEYIFAFTIETQYCDVLPKKNFLSAKNYYLQLIALVQKMIIHILQLSFNGSLESRIWISSIFALGISIFRVQLFFETLPLYKLQSLSLQASLNSVVLALSISYFFQAILFSSEYAEPSIGFMMTTGFLLSLLLIRISRSAIQELIIKLFSTKIAQNSPDLLMHKIIFLKQLMKSERLDSNLNQKYHWTFLASRIIQIHQNSFFSDDDDGPTSLNLASPTSLQKICTQYLENLAAKFPENRLIQLYFSNLEIKDLKISSKALKTIGSLIRKPYSTEYLSSFFLLYKFREVLLKDCQEKKQDILCLTTYIKSQKLISELKQKMIDQAEMQISICQNIFKDKCDIGEIFDKAQTISKLRATLHKEVLILSSKLPDYSIEYLLLCAEYYLVLEFNQIECQKYCESYHQKYLKYKKFLISPELVEENLYQSTNAFLLLAGQNKENGIVKYCSKSSEKVLGVSSQDFIFTHISSIFLPSMQNYYRNLFQKIFEKDQTDLLDQTQTIFLCHKDSFITKSQIYIQVHPFINENIYLSLIIRINSTLNDYLILKENGDIEGVTKRISKLLGLTILSTSSVNIRQISEELAIANEAFNLLSDKSAAHKPLDKISPSNISQTPFKKKSHLDYQFASELYNSYSSDGKEVQLNPFNSTLENSDSPFTYHCHIKTLSFGDTCPLKLVKLSRAKKKQETQEEKPQSPKTPKTPKTPKNKKRNSKMYSQEEELEMERNQHFITPALLTTDGNLLLPQTKPDVLLSPRINSDRGSLIKKSQDEDEFYENDIQTEPSKFKDTEQKQGEHLADFLSIKTSIFKNMQEKAIYKAYRNNISKRSYSKSFKLLCLIFYGIILLTLLSQIVLKIVYDRTMEGLVIRKDLLNYAQSRSYYASKICFSFTGIYGLTLGVDVYSLPDPVPPPSVGFALLPIYSAGLYEANQKILHLLNTIDDEDIQRSLFEKDVKIQGSIYDINDKSEHKENNFEAADLLVAAIQHLVHVKNYTSSDKRTIYEYIQNNAQGDFLAKNIQVTSLFQQSVNNQREYLKNYIVKSLVVTPLLLASVAILLTGIIWRQYSRECEYLKAFIKLDPHAIKSILKQIIILKNTLVNDASFIDKKMIEFFWGNSLQIEATQFRSRSFRKHDTQIIDYLKLKKRYFWYIAQVIFFTGILIVILIWNFLSARHHTDIIYNRQNQLQLSNYLSEQVTISVQGLGELFVSNNTIDYIQMTPKEYLESAFNKLKTLQHSILNDFLEVDGSYDSQIQTLLFDGGSCSRYQSYYAFYCDSLEKMGVLTNVVNLMSYYINSFTVSLSKQKIKMSAKIISVFFSSTFLVPQCFEFHPKLFFNFCTPEIKIIIKFTSLIDKQNFSTALPPIYGTYCQERVNIVEAKFQKFAIMDRSTLSALFYELFTGVNPLVLSSSLLANQAQLMNEIVNKNLAKSISYAEKNQNGILVVFVVCLVLVSLLIWMQILKKIKEVRNDFKKILQVLPPKLVLSSFLLKQFLNKA